MGELYGLVFWGKVVGKALVNLRKSREFYEIGLEFVSGTFVALV